MIYHTPEVKEQLEHFGVPVLVERSSYESGPLARMEWIKFIGLLLGRAEEAERVFSEKIGADRARFAAGAHGQDGGVLLRHGK